MAEIFKKSEGVNGWLASKWLNTTKARAMPPTHPAGSVPARALDRLKMVDQNQVRYTVVNVEYEHRDLLGSLVSAQFYYATTTAALRHSTRGPFPRAAVTLTGRRRTPRSSVLRCRGGTTGYTQRFSPATTIA